MGRVVKVRETILCEVCGEPLPPKKISTARRKGFPPRFCSLGCRQQKLSGNVPEPPKEGVAAFYRTVEARKAEINPEEKRLIQSLTPRDDSPEAEKRLREAVCPDPPPYIYVNGSSGRIG